MVLVDIINIKAGYIFCSYSLKIREGDRLLVKLVHYYKGRVVTVGVLWKQLKVYYNMLPGAF